MLNKLMIFSGIAGQPLVDKTCGHLSIDPCKSNVKIFDNGEVYCELAGDVENSDIFIINPTSPPHRHFMELVLIADAAKRAGAKRVIPVITDLAYGRQDKKHGPKEPLSAKVFIDMLCVVDYNRVLTIDVHNDSILGYFNCPAEQLFASYEFVPHIQKNILPLGHCLIASADHGGSKRVKRYAQFLNLDYLICDKTRSSHNKVDEINILAKPGTNIRKYLKGKIIIIIEDMVDTGGTIAFIGNELINLGAEAVYIYATHPILSGKAKEKIEDSSISRIYVTDTIPRTPEQLGNKIEVISVSKMIARAIRSINDNSPIGHLII